MWTYEANLQQSSLGHKAADDKLLSAVWFPLSSVTRIEMVIGGMWFLSKPYIIGGMMVSAASTHPLEYLLVMFLIIGSDQSHRRGVTFAGMYLGWCGAVAPMLPQRVFILSCTGASGGLHGQSAHLWKQVIWTNLLTGLVLARSGFFFPVQSWNTIKISGVKWVRSESEIYTWSLALEEVCVCEIVPGGPWVYKLLNELHSSVYVGFFTCD